MKIISTYIIIFLLLCSNVTIAQSCYDKFLKEASFEINQYNFEKAISKYKAAKICPDITAGQVEIIDQKIEQTRESYISTIKKVNEETKTALAIVQKERQISEANRLAYFANQAIEKKQYEEAFQVASLALEMVKDKPTALVEKAYGDASYLFYSQAINVSEQAILDLKISPNQDKLLILARQEAPYLYTISGELIAQLIGHKGRTTDIAFSPKDQSIATSGEEGVILLWNAEGVLQKSLHHSDEFCKSIHFSSNGNLVSVSRDKTVKCWSPDGILMYQFQYENQISKVIISPDGKNMLSYSTAGRIELRDIVSGKIISNFKEFNIPIQQAIFSSDGSIIIIAPQNKKCSIWSPEGQFLKNIDRNLESPIYALACSSNNEKIAMASLNNAVEIWDNKQLALDIHQREINNSILEFSVNNAQVLVLRDTSSFILWDLKSKEKTLFDQHQEAITQLQFSKDDKYILSASKDNTAKLWTQKGRLIMNLNLHTAPITQSIFTQDKRMIITAGKDGNVIITPLQNKIKELMKINPIKKLTKNQNEKFGIQ